MITHVWPTGGFALRRVLTAAVVVTACAYFSSGVQAQTNTGGIRGIVRDATGGVLVGVTAEATSPVLIRPSVEITNQQGLYRFEGLPIGVYKFSFTLQGFRSVVRENVRVELGRTIDLDVSMSVGSVEETVTVSASAPVVDSLHASTSTNLSQQMLEEIPAARTSWFNTVGFTTPGARSGQGESAQFQLYGSSTDQNSYQFEGIDYSSPSGGSPLWMRPNIDAVGELQIKGIGSSAEEYGFQGAVINEIIRTATDRWRGKASYFYIGPKLVSNNTPAAQYPFTVGYMSDFTAEFGGPLIKDRLWLNGMFEQYNNHDAQVGVPLDRASTSRRTKPTFKLNSKFSDRDTIDFAYTDAYHYRTGGSTSLLIPLHTTNVDSGNNPIFAAHWTHTLGTKTVFEVKGGGIWEPNQNAPPTSGDFVNSGRFDLGTGLFSVNARASNSTRFNNHAIAATLTHYADNLIKGSHDLKFGVQLTPPAVGLSAATLLNNTSYYDLNGAPYYALKREPRTSVGQMKITGTFVQDNWAVTDRVTLNLGVRFDHTTGSVPEAPAYDVHNEATGKTYPGLPGNLITFNDVSPRLGFTVKLDPEGRTVAKASYGRYFGRLVASMFNTISPGNTVSNYFYFNPATGQYDIPFYSIDPKANYGIDPNLTNQYTDQFFVGVERELMPGLGLDVSFVSKQEHSFIRVKDVRGVYVAQPFIDTFNGVTQTLTVYNRVSPSAQSLYQTTNRNDFQQEYKSLVVQANKRMSGRWQLLGSYQWERSLGNNSGAIGFGSQTFSNTSPTGFGADPNDSTNSYGPFDTNSAHTLRAAGTFHFPGGFNAGVQESYETGQPYGRVITVRGLGQGTRNIQAEPRGAYRLKPTNNLQVRVGKDFGTAGGRRVRLSLDVYNLFNTDTPVDIRNNSSQGASLFGQVLGVYTPRRAQVGIRYEF